MEDGQKLIIGRDLFNSLGLAVVQHPAKKYKKNIPGRLYLTDEQLADTDMCSDVELIKFICAANARAREEHQKLKDEESSLMWSEFISKPILRSERCVKVKIAQKNMQLTDRRKIWMAYTKSWPQAAQL